MKRVLIILLLATLEIIKGNVNPDKHKKLLLAKINKPIVLDGVEDSIWAQADSATDFVELSPYPKSKPSRRTVAKVATTDEALYALIKCYDNPKDLQLTKGQLDDRGGDAVSIMLDTFGDGRTAYKFGVTASNVRSDSRLLDDGRNRDYSWDGIWFSATKVYGWGYLVEIKIPYKSIQYDENLSEWGLDFDRYIPHLNEDIYWNAYEENEGQRISKFGKLVFNDFKPKVHGLNLEIYPVGITKAEFTDGSQTKYKANAGVDFFYNPSPKLTFQLTFNPDFAQVEADPYEFNISRYESYYSERRPFFTEGSEIFKASGKQQNTGFYRPLELFYSRRIGRKLPDGSETPLIIGSKAFGRLGSFEYGGLIALTGEKSYQQNDSTLTEPRALFGVARIKKQIMGNSSVGILFAGKHVKNHNYGVIDVDGALRESDWQLAYQIARSFKDGSGGFAFSSGFTQFSSKWATLAQARYISEDFDVEQVGFVPWIGTANFTVVTGPRWVFDKGSVKDFIVFAGASLDYTKEDAYTDRALILGANVQFRRMYGLNLMFQSGKSKDLDKVYYPYNFNISFWTFANPDIFGRFNAGYSRTYNFSRDFVSYYSWVGGFLRWKPSNVFKIGTSLNVFFEGDIDGSLAEITYNARPFVSFTPINNLTLNLYVDNLFLRSSNKLEQMLVGFLFSYNFQPKSWIYFAINEVRNRSSQYDLNGNLLPQKLHTAIRSAVFKVKYLYYF